MTWSDDGDMDGMGLTHKSALVGRRWVTCS